MICGKCSFQILCILFYEFMHLSTCSAQETEENYMSSVSWPLGGRMDKSILHWVTFPPGGCCHPMPWSIPQIFEKWWWIIPHDSFHIISLQRLLKLKGAWRDHLVTTSWFYRLGKGVSEKHKSLDRNTQPGPDKGKTGFQGLRHRTTSFTCLS